MLGEGLAVIPFSIKKMFHRVVPGYVLVSLFLNPASSSFCSQSIEGGAFCPGVEALSKSLARGVCFNGLRFDVPLVLIYNLSSLPKEQNISL